MPTYDGIGSSVTHEIEVVGDVFISNVEGGSLSTQVPFEIFSNVSGMVSPPTDSRQVRLRVQPTTQASPDDSYVTDMGIQNTTDNYFFITAPQNTSSVGDQNTFVISKTSNVGIGTTDPTSTLHVVGNELITGTLTASNITHDSELTITSNLLMGSDKTLTASNITHDSELTITSNLLMGSDKTLTASNIVGGSPLTLSSDSLVKVEGSGGLSVTGPVNVTGSISTTGSITADYLTVSSNVRAGFNTNDTSTFGKAKIGYNDAEGGAACFAQITQMNETNYALKQSSGGGVHLNRPSGNSIVFKEADVEQMRIHSGGKVGIGTNNPSYQLDIHSGTTAASRAQMRIKSNAASGDGDAVLYLDSAQTGESDIDFMTGGALNWRLRTGDAAGTSLAIRNSSDADQFVIDQNGNVDINGTIKCNKIYSYTGSTYITGSWTTIFSGLPNSSAWLLTCITNAGDGTYGSAFVFRDQGDNVVQFTVGNNLNGRVITGGGGGIQLYSVNGGGYTVEWSLVRLI